MNHMNKKPSELLNVLSLIKGNRFRFWLAMLYFSISYPLFQIIFSLLNKKLFNSVEYADKDLLQEAFMLAIILLLLTCILEPLAGYLYEKQLFITINQIRLRVFRHLIELPIRFFELNHTGDQMAKLNTDMELIRGSYFALSNLILTAVYGLGCISTMLLLNWKLSLFVIAIGFATSAINRMFLKPIRKLSDQIQERLGWLSQQFSEVVSGIRMIKIFNMTASIRRFAQNNREISNLTTSRIRKNAQMNSLNILLSAINLSGTLIVGAYMITNNATDLGTVMAVLTLQHGLTEMILGFGAGWIGLQTSLAGAARVLQLLDENKELQALANDNSGTNDAGIILHNVNFAYDSQTKIIDNINLHIKSGQTVAFVGPSGSGKSTLANMIMGLITPDEGYIHFHINNQAIQTMVNLREMIAHVPQEVFIFAGTIIDNIAIGRIDATFRQVVEASKAAQAHEFIVGLERQYNTEVGEKGVLLSGGQKQRIAIARAILKNAPVLLLDEATSALDADNEEQVIKAIMGRMKNKTIVIIAHRLSVVKNADVIFMIEKGKLIEKGSHTELMEKNGPYYMLYRSQE